jgi:biotin carboxyl carrier protein
VSGDGSPIQVSLTTEERTCERELVVSSDFVQIKEPDGSLRRLAFTSDAPQQQSTRFFHEGRLRTVDSVGGVGAGVEGTQSEGTVCAPMNGQVVKVPVKVGDILECGEIVLILEAMKMENEVVAPISGKVVELTVSAGQTVSPGQNLFTIESVE